MKQDNVSATRTQEVDNPQLTSTPPSARTSKGPDITAQIPHITN